MSGHNYWEQAAALKNFGIHQQQGRAHRYIVARPDACNKCYRTALRVADAFGLETCDEGFRVGLAAHAGYREFGGSI